MQKKELTPFCCLRGIESQADKASILMTSFPFP